ncbi:MAG: DUF3352 domain-containing protein [Coleofasciculaceae cyanobacterium]
MRRKKKLYRLLTLGAAVLLIGGGVVTYWLLARRDRFQGNTFVSGQLVPQDALVAASISTNSEQWQQLRKYGTPESKAALAKQLNQLKQELLTDNGYSYEKDIQPWLGETAMIAYLPSVAPVAPLKKEDNKQGKEPAWFKPPDLIVLPIDNQAQARRLLAKAKSGKTKQLVERNYRGISIIETPVEPQKENSGQFAASLLGRFLVVTKNPQITERVIDTYKGKPSIDATSGYAEKLSKIQVSQPFAQFYLNMPAVLAAAAANSRDELSVEQLATDQEMQGVVTTLTLEPEGMRFQSVSWLKPNSRKIYRLKNVTSNLPRRLPANTLLMLSGSNLAQLWQEFVQSSQSNPLTPLKPAAISGGLKATLDLDLEEDLLPWMGGEFSLALLPASEKAFALEDNQPPSPLGAALVLMLKASSRSRAEATFADLDEVMATRYQFRIEETKIDGQPVVSWTSPLGGVNATHGWLEDKVAFFTLGTPIISAIIPEPEAILTQNPLFQTTVPTQPSPNNGQFYLDVERTINNSNLNSPQLPPYIQLLAKAINTIGLTVATSDERSTRLELFVQLKTTPKTSPSPSSSPSSNSAPDPQQPRQQTLPPP